MTTDTQRILIVEDQAETRAWLRELLLEVFPGSDITEAPIIERARASLAAQRFDLALIDLQLPDGSGIDLLRDIRRDTPGTYCVVATIFDDDGHLFDALRAGAQGYLVKDQDPAQLAQQLRGIVDGQPPLSPGVARRVLGFFSQPATGEPAEPLSEREREVLALIARGLRLREVAASLGISVHTVGHHVKNIYGKLQVCNRAEAAVKAVRLGLVPPTED